jgi:hypothetical protein
MPTTETEQLVVQLEARITDFEKNFQKASRTANDNWSKIEARGRSASTRMRRDIATASTGIATSLKGIGATFSATLGVTGALSAAGILTALVQVNHELAKMDSLAKTAGLSTDRLQEVKYAANLGGVDDAAFANDLHTSLGLLDEAQRRVNDLQRLFNANGLSIRDANGQLLAFDGLLERAATLISHAPTEAAKARIAAMLGLSRDWIAVLEKGPAAFSRVADEARSAGYIVDKATIEKAKEFDKAWAQALVKFKAGFVSTLADLTEAFSEFFSDLIESVPGGKFIENLFYPRNLTKLSLPQLREALERAIENGIGGSDVANRIQDEIDRRTGKKPFKVRVNAQPEIKGPATVIPEAVQKSPFTRATDEAQKRIAELNAETATINENSEARERAKLVTDLEAAAKRANTQAGFQNAQVTDAQRQKIDELADSMEDAARGSREAKELMQAIGSVKGAFADAFGGAIIEGKKLNEVVQSLVKSLAQMALRAALIGPSGAGGIFGAILKPFGFADGGYVSGPGTARSDSIPARLSDGEFVVNANATSKHRRVLEAINSGTIARYANGGPVGKAAQTFAPVQSTSVVQNVSVQVQGSAGTPAENSDLADKIARQLEPIARSMVGKELRTQMRPGGLLSR